MSIKFNPAWNEGYDFNDPKNISEIRAVDSYDLQADHDSYSEGQAVLSPWGSNQVVAVWKEGEREYCKKLITIRPGFMLSLQRHRGREETWKVQKGVLTVICDGQVHNIPAGDEIFISKGAVHCMINMSDMEVAVEEVQGGICRERDNIRLVDFSGRTTYPLTSEIERHSANLYLEIMRVVQSK